MIWEENPLFSEAPIYTSWKGSMGQLPCVLVYHGPVYKSPPLGSWAIYFYDGVTVLPTTKTRTRSTIVTKMTTTMIMIATYTTIQFAINSNKKKNNTKHNSVENPTEIMSIQGRSDPPNSWSCDSHTEQTLWKNGHGAWISAFCNQGITIPPHVWVPY